MAPLVLVLALLAPAFCLPFATLENTPGIQVEQETVTNNEPQTQSVIQQKTGVPVSTGCSAGYSVPVSQENVVQPVTKVHDAPANVEQTPASHAEPLFLPPQPVAATQDQVVGPVIVPAEAIASGRMIFMTVEPIQQRAFPDVIIVPQSIVSETPIQQVEPAEKQTPYQGNYSPVQANPNAQQNQQPNFSEVSQKQSQVQPETIQHQVYPGQAVEKQAVQPEAQVQPVQTVQQVEYVEKQAQQTAGYTPVEPIGQAQTAEPVERVQLTVQPAVQNQQQLQENIQQVEPAPQQQVYAAQTVPTYVQKQADCGHVQSQSESQQRINVQETVSEVQQPEVEVQQQTFNVQPEQVVQQTQSVEPQQKVQPEVHPPVTRTENQQAQNEPQQVSSFVSGQIYNFGDKIPQPRPVETGVYQQQHLVQPVVVKN